MNANAIARDVSTQAIALVLFVLVNFFFIRVVVRLPALNAMLMAALTIGFAAIWAGLLLWRLLLPAAASDRDRIVRQDTAIIWGGTALSALFFWLAMPFATEGQRMLAVFFTAATVAHTTLATIRPIDAGPVRRAALLGLPVSTVVYFLVHCDAYSVPVIFFSVANAGSFVTLRGVAQRSIARARDARRKRSRPATHAPASLRLRPMTCRSRFRRRGCSSTRRCARPTRRAARPPSATSSARSMRWSNC